MLGNIIEEVSSYKYLGTDIDNRLSGDEQFSKLLQMLGFKLRTFSKVRRYLDNKAALSVYKSMILPVIDYNDHFQLLWNKNKLDKLQKYQNWGLRMVYYNLQPKLDEEGLHNHAKVSKLKYRRIAHLLGVMYHRSKVGDYVDVREIGTRQHDKVKFKVMNPSVKKAFRSPNYLGAQL